MVTKSPLTGLVACSNSGGFIGAELKNAGGDMIIFAGRGHFSVRNKPEYWGNSGGLEYEVARALGSDTGIDDMDALI